jgi:hypothetical protein
MGHGLPAAAAAYPTAMPERFAHDKFLLNQKVDHG